MLIICFEKIGMTFEAKGVIATSDFGLYRMRGLFFLTTVIENYSGAYADPLCIRDFCFKKFL